MPLRIGRVHRGTRSAVDRAFHWPLRRDVRSLRVGYVEALFEEDRSERAEKEEEKARLREWQEYDRRTLEVLPELGIELIPIKLPAEEAAAGGLTWKRAKKEAGASAQLIDASRMVEIGFTQRSGASSRK